MVVWIRYRSIFSGILKIKCLDFCMCFHGVSWVGPKWWKFPRLSMNSRFYDKTLKRFFYTSRLPAVKRIGPHNDDILSTLVGNLLGNSWGEKRSGATRFHLHMGSPNREYLHWLHKYYAQRGYCSSLPPKVSKQIGRGGKISFSYKWRTWSFSSLNWLYDSFYTQCPKRGKGMKRIPLCVDTLLTPRALAVWIMNDGSASSAGVRISTEGFSFGDVSRLHDALKKNFDLVTTLPRHGDKWVLYFPKSQCGRLSTIVKPFMVHSMWCKLRHCDV